MLSNNILRSNLLRRAIQNACKTQTANVNSISRIGNREVVGYGWNGSATYGDRPDYPFPAIRFKESTPDVVALRGKEKADWKNLTVEEKKLLYRISFRQTFAEIHAPTGDWKLEIGVILTLASFCVWVFMGIKKYISLPLPYTCNEEGRAAQLRRMLDHGVGRINGLSAKWDYEKDDWKK